MAMAMAMAAGGECAGDEPEAGQLSRLSASVERLGAREEFRFGLITDIQYADKDDGAFTDEFGRVRALYFRRSLQHLRAALSEWRDQRAAFAMQLGDLIDGYANDAERSLSDLARARKELDAHDIASFQWHHVVGNHCRYAPRKPLLEALGLENGRSYYAFSPAPGWRFVVLDGAELCMAAVDADGAEKREFAAVCADLGLDPASRAEWNGAMSRAQLAWLEEELEQSSTRGETVVAFGHFPLSSDGAMASPASHLLTNAESVLALFRRHRDCVLAYFCGHDHFGGIGAKDAVHHVTVPGVLEARDIARFCSVAAARDAANGSPLLVVHGTLAPEHNSHRLHVLRKLS